ncbi:multidrug effflux MFS transporter [Neisseriaceae bacterium ESL0693]|nr:multidrug effflux MFS transporter [Neisseriaceae bacterium ESL0693]
MNPPSHLSLSASRFALLLAAMVAIMPFSTDIYLSAVPEMAKSLNANIHMVEKSLASFMFGVAIGQLMGGAISDIKGRKIMAMIGLGVYLLATLGLLFVQTAEQLLFFRWIQAIGGGMMTVTVGAVVRDFFQGREAAKMFATIGIITLGAPLAAPMLGAMLQSLGNWRIIFVFLTLYALVVIVLVWYFLPRSQIQKQPLDWRIFKTIGHNFVMVFSQREALGFMFFQIASFSSMFVFLTESTFIYRNLYGLNAHQYAWAFGANIITMMLFNRITAYRLRTTAPQNILISGIVIQLISNVLLVMLVWSMQQLPFALLLVLIMFSVGSQGLIGSNTQACFMGYFHKVSGSANAVLGTTQFLVAALAGWLTTELHNGTAHVMPSMMLAATCCGVVLLWLFSRQAWQK